MVNQGQSGFKYPSQYGMILSWLLQFVEEELLFPLTHHAPLITDISSHIPLALRVIKKVCYPAWISERPIVLGAGSGPVLLKTVRHAPSSAGIS